MTHRAALFMILAATTALVACEEDRIIVEPAAPAVHGNLSLDTDVDPLQWTMLEARFAPTHDLESDDPSEGEGYVRLEDLAELEFPFEYWFGGGFGTSAHSEWRLVVWLSNEDYEAPREFWDEVPDDCPWAEAVVDLGDCSNGCGAGEADLMLAW